MGACGLVPTTTNNFISSRLNRLQKNMRYDSATSPVADDFLKLSLHFFGDLRMLADDVGAFGTVFGQIK